MGILRQFIAFDKHDVCLSVATRDNFSFEQSEDYLNPAPSSSSSKAESLPKKGKKSLDEVKLSVLTKCSDMLSKSVSPFALYIEEK